MSAGHRDTPLEDDLWNPARLHGEPHVL